MLDKKLPDNKSTLTASNKTQNLASCIRILSADAVEKANSGHPGMPLGFADIATVLMQKFLKFNPNDPSWFNRDRLVLSAGHGSMLLYSLYYLCGYKDFTLNQIKNFRKLTSICAGHPEYDLSTAIETTTGPLGQGIGNAVGFAIAQKKYQAILAKKNLDHLCDYKIFCIAGDGCLMEGISYESMSLAGHLNLDNLIILFDDNGISIDGPTSLAVSEDHIKKMQSFGFHTISANGHDADEIEKALAEAIASDKPSFISFKTEIGHGANKKAGSEKSHGSPLGEDEIDFLKSSIGAETERFSIKDGLLDEWRNFWRRNKESYDKWYDAFVGLELTDKKFLGPKELIIPNKESEIRAIDLLQDEATRVSSGKILAKIMELNDKVICGSADLAGSNNVKNNFAKSITRDDFTGNFINFGVREHAMGAICNGLALSGFTPICSTFFVFSDYMRPAIRLAALMQLPVIYIMTHDSIGVGEDGPTHQPIEHLASFRAMPGINLYRPADGCETLCSYKKIASKNDVPSMLVLSRQKLPNLHTEDDLFFIANSDISDFIGTSIMLDEISIEKANENLGVSIIPSTQEEEIIIEQGLPEIDIDFALFTSGSEVSLALDVQENLQKQGITSAVIPIISMDILLEAESKGVKILENADIKATHLVAIEAGCEFGWHKIIGSDGLFFGINSFGKSAPCPDLFKHYGLTAQNITEKLLSIK